MTKKMLIDATQPEETRVAVIDGDRLDSYDFDSSVRKQIKGNIFLAKVTRVEPSLQACFVEYGGNRQGFLAFTEIHPDYYRIPVEDRQALLAEEAEMLEDEDDFDGNEQTTTGENPSDIAAQAGEYDQPDSPMSGDNSAESYFSEEPVEKEASQAISAEAAQAPALSSDIGDEMPLPAAPNLTEVERDNTIERVGGGSEEESAPQNRARRQGRLRKRYKIQEVIKRRQIMLVQATKEERGQKGAAMTTYISLPGRYCVLMPNSPRGGGVSRKITDPRARRKMKELLAELNVPQGMSIILRTAGITRSKIEIKRDFDYLLKLWDEIRRETMQSVAPAMVYEEADIFKRTIRDLYARDTTEIIVSGEIGYKRVKTFMYQMVPAHAPRVKFYRDPKIPLFQNYGIEHQIADIFSPRVELRSGGYIIINPTEALVSIDVNSGRATRERHIDDTALKTNMEAATEIARQLRLRDLGGLVVIDFIDMDSNRHNAKVERRLREAMSSDRARIEIGRISGFGLLELSRQRLHPSLTETHFEQCKHCNGTGLVRTIDSAAIVAMRAIEAEAVKGRAIHIIANVPQQVAVYILNHKREEMNRIEDYFGCRVSLRVDEELQLNDMNIESEKGNPVPRKIIEQLPMPFIEGVDDQPVVEDEPDEEISEEDLQAEEGSAGENGEERRSRNNSERGERNGPNGNRRGRRGGRNRRERGSERNDRRPREAGVENGENGDVITIPITDGSQPESNDIVSNTVSEDQPSGEGRNNPRRNNHRRGGRHPYRRGRNNDRRDNNRGDGASPIQAADAPASEPAVMVTRSNAPQPDKRASADSSAANDGGGDTKRGWWQKLID